LQTHAKICLVSVALMTLSACAGEAVDEGRKTPPRPMASAGNGGYAPYGYAGSGALGKGGGGASAVGAGSAGYAGASGGTSGAGAGGASNAGASGSAAGHGGSAGSIPSGTAGANSGANCPSLTLARTTDGKCVPRITEFEVARKPTSIVTGSDGKIWVDDDQANQFIQLDNEGRITRRVDCDSGSSPRAMVAGKGDSLFWYTTTQSKQLIKVTGDSDKASVTYLPFSASAVALGTNDELFLAEFGKAIYRVIPEQQSPTSWKASPIDVLVLNPADNSVWTSQGSGLAQLKPSVGVKNVELAATSYASGMCVGPDMALWFSDGFADQLVQVSFDGKLANPVNLPTTTQPGQIITGPDKALWFVEQGKLKIGRFNPKTGELTHYPLPTSGARPGALTLGRDNNIWFTEENLKVGRLIPDPIVP